MKTLRLKKQFKKDAKKSIRNPRNDTGRLNQAFDILREISVLPQEYLPHQLVGNWHPLFECHIQSDFLLIYEVTEIEVILHHSNQNSKIE